MDITTAVGGVAAVASTISFAPQAWKIIRSRRTADISAPGFAVTAFAFSCWLTYGVLLGEWPIIASNVICLSFAVFILTMKLLPRRQKEQVAEALDPTGAPAQRPNR